METSSDEDEGPEVQPSKSRKPGRGRHRFKEPHSEASGSSGASSGDAAEEEDDREEQLQAAVADVPFEVLTAMKSDGRGTLKAPGRRKADIHRRANKNRPMELPAKKPVPRFREVLQAPKREFRDPRFESLTGKFDERIFKNSYKFVYDEQLPAEKQAMKKQLKKEKDPEEKQRLKQQLAKVEQSLQEEVKRRQREAKEAERKRQEREAVKAGKRPFYLKKSDLRKQELVEKFKELKAKGKLEAFLAKRRKKNASKDRRYVPYRRAGVKSEQDTRKHSSA